jgi:ArsR family transcriptional regulator, arsenate/arsenite/antimonite-responsive transcriptional repressor / arsenate reductase (thioredoxin)
VGPPGRKPGGRQIRQTVLIQSGLLDYDRSVTVAVEPATRAEAPPAFVRLLSHPVRWRLLRQLVLSDRTVGELSGLVDEPPNLVSYHLRHLRDGGIVVGRRSSADGRDTYYTVDLAACVQQLRAAGGALHPALLLASSPRPPRIDDSGHRPRVLFLCTGNSARSQIAEALLEQLSEGTVEAISAGSHPKPLHPDAVRVMRERGIDLGGNRSKHVDEFVAESFDLVVTLCDRVREVCPEFPAHPQHIHWSVPDPATVESTDSTNEPSNHAFEATAADLERRIGFLLYLLAEISRRSTHGK